MVHPNRLLYVCQCSMRGELKLIAPRLSLGIRQANNVLDIRGAVSLHNIEPALAEQKRPKILMVFNILHWESRKIGRWGHGGFEYPRILEGYVLALRETRDIDWKVAPAMRGI